MKNAKIKPYTLGCVAAMLTVQLIIYFGSSAILDGAVFHDISTPLDEKIPFVPFWISIYTLAYMYWAISGIIFLLLSDNKERTTRFAIAYILHLFIAGAIFIIYPTTLMRPEVTGGDFFSAVVRLIYSLDAPRNLLPSLHVSVSYLCWRGTFGSDKIPKWYKAFSLVFNVLVALSILFVKQHVVVDIPSAIIVAELSLWVSKLPKLWYNY